MSDDTAAGGQRGEHARARTGDDPVTAANMYRLGSLCTGIGGLDLAVERHFGAAPAWHSEVEPAPCQVLDRHWPGVPNHGDLTLIDWGSIPPVDILTAGYPCQPFSLAGSRQGASDVRHLWPFVAEAVRVLRPRWVVLENVAGHLTLGFGDVLRDLAEAGFDAEWCLLRASDVGAPHRRERLFIVARDTQGDHGRDARQQASRGPWRAQGEAGEPALLTPADPQGNAGGLGDGDSGAPTHADSAGCQARGERQGHRDAGRLQPLVGGDEVAWGPYLAAIRRWSAILGRPAPRPTDDAGRLNPSFVEWMMGYPEGWVDGLTRSQALKALGNAVVTQQALAACDELAPEWALAGAVA